MAPPIKVLKSDAVSSSAKVEALISLDFFPRDQKAASVSSNTEDYFICVSEGPLRAKTNYVKDKYVPPVWADITDVVNSFKQKQK